MVAARAFVVAAGRAFLRLRALVSGRLIRDWQAGPRSTGHRVCGLDRAGELDGLG